MSLRSSSADLSRYIAIRDELISDLESMTQIVERDQTEESDLLAQTIVEKMRRRLQRLREDRLSVGVFGETCSGKSTLINSLSRREVTRPDVVSNTGSIMEFEYGEVERLEVHFADGRVEPTTWAALPTFTDQLHNPENTKGVSKVHICLPLSYLKNGIKFYDTPGLNDVIRAYTDLSARFLDEMGAVIITSIYPPYTRGEMDFLKRASHQCDKLFLIINLSSDFWPQRDRLREKVIQNIQRDPDLKSHPDLQPQKLRIYLINARQAWEAIEKKDEGSLKDSGFPVFQDDLERFLAQDASRTVLASSIRSSFEIITLLQKLLTLRGQVLFTKRSDVEKKIKEVQQKRQKADYKKYELFDAIDAEIKSLSSQIEPQVLGMMDQTLHRLKEITQLKVYGQMLEEIEALYVKNGERSEALEKIITSRIETLFRASHRWLHKQLDDLLAFENPEISESSAKNFALSRSQKSLLGMMDGYEDHLGVAEAMVGFTTIGAGVVAGGQGAAFLSFLGPLAFPIGGVGGFFLGMFARNFLKAATIRQHIEQQIRQIQEGRDILADKLLVVLERVSQGIKTWVAEYFDTLFNRLASLMEEHRKQLDQAGYIEKQRRLLEERQAELDAIRDRFLVRLEEIRSLLAVEADPAERPV